MATFKALRIDKADKGTTATIAQFDEAEFASLTPDADVTVAVEWSTLNYKDGLAVTGKSPVVRRFPMIAGIDFAGIVTQSSNPNWKTGDRVVCNGWGMGDPAWGLCREGPGQGRLAGKLPDAISTRDAMAIGTAGYTRCLRCWRWKIRLEAGFGADGGDRRGRRRSARSRPPCSASSVITFIASTGRAAEADYLEAARRQRVIDRSELAAAARPLNRSAGRGGATASARPRCKPAR